MYSDFETNSYLLDYLSRTVRTLDHDKDGMECIAKMRSILAEHPNVEKIVFGQEATELSAEDAAALIRYLEVRGELETLEHWVCYKRGIVDGICTAKDSGKFK